MNVTIELRAGTPPTSNVCKADIQKNIDGLERILDRCNCGGDFMYMIDTIGILKAIQRELPQYPTWHPQSIL